MSGAASGPMIQARQPGSRGGCAPWSAAEVTRRRVGEGGGGGGGAVAQLLEPALALHPGAAAPRLRGGRDGESMC